MKYTLVFLAVDEKSSFSEQIFLQSRIHFLVTLRYKTGGCVMELSSGRLYARVIGTSCGVTEVTYTGVMTDLAFSELCQQVAKQTQRHGALLIRLESTLRAMSAVPDAPGYTKNMPPAAVVCQESELDFWDAYGKKVSRAGVMRAVFSLKQLDLARMWARRQLHAGL